MARLSPGDSQVGFARQNPAAITRSERAFEELLGKTAADAVAHIKELADAQVVHILQCREGKPIIE
jgi:hypothetical protein